MPTRDKQLLITIEMGRRRKPDRFFCKALQVISFVSPNYAPYRACLTIYSILYNGSWKLESSFIFAKPEVDTEGLGTGR